MFTRRNYGRSGSDAGSSAATAEFLQRLRLKLWQLRWHLILAFAIGTGVLIMAGIQARDDLRVRLIGHAEVAAVTIDSGAVARLEPTPEAALSLDYAYLKTYLRRVAKETPGCRFAYVMKRLDTGEVVFVADSEPTGSEDESPPGQVYEEATELIAYSFETGEATFEGPVTDRWGTWFSATTPIRDADGQLVGLLGMVVGAHEWHVALFQRAVIGASWTLVAVAGLWMLITTLSTVGLVARTSTGVDQRLTRIVWLIRGATCLVIVGSFAAIWWVGSVFTSLEGSGLHTRQQDFRLQRLAGEILRLDEVLTMSAKMSAATGDDRWKRRYDEHVDLLDNVIAESLALEPTALRDFLARTEDANRRLVAMETRAFEHVEAGDRARASEILESDAYAGQKARYKDAIDSLARTIESHAVAIRVKHNDVATRVSAVLSGILGLILISAAALLRSMVRHLSAEQQLREVLEASHRELVSEVEVRGIGLKQSDLRYRATLNSIADPLICSDHLGVVIGINPAAVALTGWSMADAIGKAVSDVVVLVASDELNEGFGKGAPPNYLVARDGSRRPVIVTEAPVKEATGAILGKVMVLRDVSREIERTAVISQERRRLAAVIAGTGAGTWDWHIPSNRANFDERWAELLGIRLSDLGEIDMSTWEAFCHPDDLVRAQEALQRHFSGETEYYTCEVRMRHRNGSWVWILDHGRVDAWDSSGKPVHMSGMLSDITERKAAEAALVESQETLRRLFDGSADPVLLIRDGLFIDCNHAALAMLGLTEKTDLVGHDPATISPKNQPDGRSSVESSSFRIAQAQENGSQRFEWVHVRPDGSELFVDVMLTSITIRGEQLLHVVWRDISEAKRTELQLRTSEERFRGLFELSPVGIVLHDFATGAFLDCNQAFLAATGFQLHELRGLTFAELLKSGVRSGSAIPIELDEFGRFGPMEADCAKSDGTALPVLLNGLRLQGSEGTDVLWSMWEDIEERKNSEAAMRRQAAELTVANAKLERIALSDTLTSLANRRRFLELLRETVSSAEESGSMFAVFFLDLDNFKNVNDSLGHDAGDQLLTQVADRMRNSLRDTDELARFGGDEFAMLIRPIPNLDAAGLIADRLVKVMEAPFELPGHSIPATVSIGVACYTGSETVEQLLQDADIAMYYAKHSGKSGYRFFEPWMTDAAQARLALESDLRRAWENREFEVYYQPLVDLETGEAAEVEALVRWNHPVRGMVSPGEFIPLAEEINLIGPIGDWVLEQACAAIARWKASGAEGANLRAAVNVSGRQIRRATFASDVAEILARTGVAPGDVTLEVTETMLMTDLDTNIEKLVQVRELGVKVAIDDFGTGYSSMGSLANLPVDVVKVDRSFVSAVGDNLEPTAIIRALVMLCRTLRLTVVGEGIETEDQLVQLQTLGCNLGQGYLFSRPLPEPALLAWLRASAGQDAA